MNNFYKLDELPDDAIQLIAMKLSDDPESLTALLNTSRKLRSVLTERSMRNYIKRNLIELNQPHGLIEIDYCKNINTLSSELRHVLGNCIRADQGSVLKINYFLGKPHSINDEHAVYLEKNKAIIKIWMKDGEIHRDDDKPSVERYNIQSSEYIYTWYQHDIIHRDNDLPAVINKNSKGEVEYKKWYENGKISRSNGLPAIISDSSWVWYKNGEIYRDDNKPVIINYDSLEYVIDRDTIKIVNNKDFSCVKRFWSDDIDDYVYENC